MRLKQGIRLYSLLPEGYDAVFINSGTSSYKEQTLAKVDFQDWHFTPLFEEDAYLPKKDWRKMNTQESAIIRAKTDRKDHNTIFTGYIPAELQDIIRRLGLEQSKNREEVMQKFRDHPETVQQLNTKMQEFLSTIADNKPFHFHCIAANLPNLEMVACDITRLRENFTVPEKRYIGLHNDGTQFMTLHTTHKAGNRITINLGNQSRIFYFVNLTMIQALNMLSEKIDVKEQQVNIYNVSAHFFKHFPDYPVIKFIQQPYQFYIAPTDNCFHDGSTLGNTALDINMVYFGTFRC